MVIILIFLVWYLIGLYSGVRIITQDEDVTGDNIMLVFIFGFIGPFGLLIILLNKHKKTTFFKKRDK